MGKKSNHIKLSPRYLRFYVKALLKLVRWPNLLMVLATQYIVYAFVIQAGESWAVSWCPVWTFFVITMATMLVAAAGYIINDYYDIKIDLVNKPGRIVIGRIVSRRQAILLHTVLNGLAIGMGLLLSWRVALFLAGCAFLLWLYSNYLKRTAFWGNVTVSALTAATVWIVALYYKTNDHLVYVYSAFAFMMSLIREIIKDMEDVKGDAVYGCRTLPIVWGFRKTKVVLGLLLLVFSVLLLWQSSYAQSMVQAWVYHLLLLPVFYLGYKIAMADKQKDYAHLSTFCKWLMVVGACSLGAV
jgi:4-hydroxybenzoate polyprenyltransferase